MRHILHLLAIRNLSQLRHEQIHISLNHPRQILRRRRGESRTQQTPDARVGCVGRKDNVVICVTPFGDWVLQLVLTVLPSARQQAVDVLPCIWLGERKVVGRDAHNCAVSLVDVEDVERESASGA
jgi:hypothetical protein